MSYDLVSILKVKLLLLSLEEIVFPKVSNTTFSWTKLKIFFLQKVRLCKSQIQSVLHKIDKPMNLKRLKLCTILYLKIATKTVILKHGPFSTKVVRNLKIGIGYQIDYMAITLESGKIFCFD
jgi:hypothetical protein